ncbi:(R)-hydratase [Marinicauda salina]|uniref:(R)-hydratase n=1 Tax=Marinicauda salina TaxID=2135793 RepID=A0A2U2BSH8_9PROT|nr:MaoC family dehydratase [Marinicauda salina]PWE16936.1 (R)-hydratase [Marinicauda salina]
MSNPQGFGISELSVGQTASIERRVDEEIVRKFAEVSGDFNPIHMDADYAAKTPFRERIAHGALVASFISCVLGNHLPGPGAVFQGMTMRFLRPVHMGDTVTARATVTDVDVRARQVKLKCACEVDGEVCMEADAEVMVRKRRVSA